jgi:microcystin-dependent protein
MGQPYVGEIRMGGWNFNPQGWAFCDGSLLSIAQNDVLFNLIGTTYGGDGQNTFALPNLLGRIPMHAGNGYVLGQSGGSETEALTVAQIPAHAHTLTAQTPPGNQMTPQGGVWARSSLEQFAPGAPSGSMSGTLLQSGGDQPHSNMPTFLGLNFVISFFGIFPSQN